MEELMVKAIRQFKEEHKHVEIRTCSVYAMTGEYGNREDALFHIEYVEASGKGKVLREVNVQVSK